MLFRSKRFRGIDPQTGQPDYWNRGGVAGLLGMPSWDQQSPTDIAMGFAGSTTPALKGVAGALAKPQGIRAYHGSPHDFDRFDLSKIGTGEGAQAYGHGLYFAENEGVARSYKAAGQPHYLGNDRAQAALDLLKETGGDKAAALALADQRMKATTKYSEGKLWMDVVNNFDELVGRGPGKMYEVQINADPERFLDWDKPLSGQPAAMDRLRRMGALKDDGSLSFMYRESPRSGGEVYERLTSPMAEKLTGGHGAVAATSALREAGIPGIKYLDQGSRSAGEGSRNYVVFDDKLIDILRKYGLLGPMAGGATAGAVGDY